MCEQAGAHATKRKRSSKSEPVALEHASSSKHFNESTTCFDETRYLAHRDVPRPANDTALDDDEASPHEHKHDHEKMPNLCETTLAARPHQKVSPTRQPSTEKHEKVPYGRASPSKAADDTCFFRDHGRCARAENEKNHFKCPHKHSLSSKSSRANEVTPSAMRSRLDE